MPDPQLFQAYVACAAAQFFNLVFLGNGTAIVRSKAKQMLNPEDKKVNADGSVTSGDADAAGRFVRAHRNALENIPVFLVLSLVYVGLSPDFNIAVGLMAGFTAFRWLHSLCYVNGAQPWRTVSFALSHFIAIGMVIHMLVLVFA